MNLAASQKQENENEKYLTFRLRDEDYGIEILKVREIIGLLPITRVPRTPDFVKGVINLRGKIIPVTDLRARFGLDVPMDTSETCIIVVQTNGLEIGVIVDQVSEVLEIPASETEETPNFGGDASTDFLLGLGKTGEKVTLLIDIDKIVSVNDMIEINSSLAKGEAITN